MDEPIRRGARIISVHALYQDAGLSVYQRQQRVDDVQQRVVALTLDQGVDADALAAVIAAQSARTRLAAHTTRSIAQQADERQITTRRRNR